MAIPVVWGIVTIVFVLMRVFSANPAYLMLGQRATAEWGYMLSSGRNFIFSAYHIITFPGLAIAVTVLSFNLLGDGLRDALDPRLKEA